jgi:hypothetical protein
MILSFLSFNFTILLQHHHRLTEEQYLFIFDRKKLESRQQWQWLPHRALNNNRFAKSQFSKY